MFNMTNITLLQQELVQDPRYRDSFKGATIYGVAGTNGSGKDLLIDFLVEKGFFAFNTGDALRKITKASLGFNGRGGNESPEGRTANAQRRLYPGGMVELGLITWWSQIAHLPDDLKPRGLVIGSIRGTGEAERLKELGGKLIIVDADVQVRFQRVMSRQRPDELELTFEKFQHNEDAEMAYGETDPTKFGMAAVIDMGDIRIENNGSDIEAFKTAVEKLLSIS